MGWAVFPGFVLFFRESLIYSIPLMVRQAHYERNQKVTVHPEPGACRTVEGFNQRFLKGWIMPGFFYTFTLSGVGVEFAPLRGGG
jgi:hypothetical protein